MSEHDTIKALREWARTTSGLAGALVMACLDSGAIRCRTNADTLGLVATEVAKLAATLERRLIDAHTLAPPPVFIACPHCVPPSTPSTK